MRIVTTTRRLQPWPEDHLLGPPVTYPDGTTIFRKGQPIRTISVVVSGIVLVLASGESEDGLVAVRTSDWPLAAVPAIDGRSMHVATAVALGPCELRQIHVPAFLELRLRDPRVNIWIGNLLAAEAMEQLEWLVALSAGDLRARLLHVLVALFRASSVERPDGSLRLRPAISRTLLAKLVLAERESVVRQIGRLETEGVITRADGWIEVPRPFKRVWIPSVHITNVLVVRRTGRARAIPARVAVQISSAQGRTEHACSKAPSRRTTSAFAPPLRIADGGE